MLEIPSHDDYGFVIYFDGLPNQLWVRYGIINQSIVNA